MPITWKNVGQNIGAGAAADFMRGAGRSVEAGLDKLTGALRSVRDDRQGQYDHKVEQNTDKVQDFFSKYKTVEELDAAEQSGELERLFASVGDTVDRDEVRGIAGRTRDQLRNREIAGVEHKLKTTELEDTVAKRELRPEIENIQSLIEAGNFDAAETAIEANSDSLANIGLLNEQREALRLRQEGKQDRDTRLSDAERARQTEIEERDRQKAARTADDILSSAIDTSRDSAAQARQTYENRIAMHNKANPDNQIPDAIADAQLQANLDGRWRTRWGLTEDQQRQIERENQVYDMAREQAVEFENAKLAELESEHEELQRFSWNAPERETVGKVRQEMRTGLDGDPEKVLTTDQDEIDFIVSKLDEEIENAYAPKRQVQVAGNQSVPGGAGRTETVVNPLYDPNRNWGEEARAHKGDILREVARRLSPEGKGLERIDGIDLNQSNDEIVSVINQVLEEFQSSTRRTEQVKAARDATRLRTNAIEQTFAGAKRAYRDSFDELNRARDQM